MTITDEERRARRREYMRGYRAAHPHGNDVYARRYRERNRERLRRYAREYYRKHHTVIGRRRNAENRKRRHDAAPDGFRHLLRSADACRLLQCSRETLRELRDAREIIAVRNPSGGKTASFLHDPVSIAILLNSGTYPRIISHSKSQHGKIQHFR